MDGGGVDPGLLAALLAEEWEEEEGTQDEAQKQPQGGHSMPNLLPSELLQRYKGACLLSSLALRLPIWF